MEYKQTLHLPQTDFPMKADLPKREPEFLARWEKEDIYGKMTQKNRGKTPFILHDGPPYANGNIHFGHILNKVLKDIIVKSKSMSGYFAPFVPGWDCHGLPIELGAMKEMPEGVAGPIAKRQACRDYATGFIESQKKDFKRLGVFGDWEHPYLTLTNKYEADIAREFARLYSKGYVYEGKKPVYWCSSCQTALAEAEVEYENLSSPSIFVKFELEPESVSKLGIVPDLIEGKKISFVIWTTTPWTLPANVGLCLGPEYDYVGLDDGREVLIVARDLKQNFLNAIGKNEEVIDLEIWKGFNLSEMKLKCRHPFMDRQSLVISGNHVTLETGTGVVHTAPGHGQEDFMVGQEFGLPTLCPVDHQGKFIAADLSTATYPAIKELAGIFVKKADKIIVPFLAEIGALLNKPGETITHSYPHCWRCKNPLIFRATEQWFCSLSHNNLRKRTLKAIDCEVKWIPSWGHDRIYGMIENRPDWCLSRQRIWGVPIIVHKCTDCRKNLLSEEIGNFIGRIFEEKGADAWWGDDKPLLPLGTRCECGSENFVKEKSILDVWFDSGVSHAAVLEDSPDLGSPADLYLEGSDQHRGWFHSSLLTAIATRDHPPYKAALTHGFVVDGEGKKYSKSAKNYTPPDKILNQMGAELLRLWVGAEDYRNDIRVSDEILKSLAEIYRKIRNTCRFMLGNIHDFNAATDTVPLAERTELDRYALHLLAQVSEKVMKAYENYEFHIVHHSINKFFTVDLSAKYLDILKDRLYCDRADGHLRRSAQSTINDILMTVVPLMAPILSFTAEEIWGFMPHKENLTSSIFLASFPKIPADWQTNVLADRWERIGGIRDEVLKVLEGARQKKEIGHPLDAKIILSAEGDLLRFLKTYEKDWAQIFIVSQVEIVDALASPNLTSTAVLSLKVSVTKALGVKCERCWNYSVEVGQTAAHPSLCGRCVKAVS